MYRRLTAPVGSARFFSMGAMRIRFRSARGPMRPAEKRRGYLAISAVGRGESPLAERGLPVRQGRQLPGAHPRRPDIAVHVHVQDEGGGGLEGVLERARQIARALHADAV